MDTRPQSNAPQPSSPAASAHTPGPWVAIHDPGHSSEDLTDNGGYRIDAPEDDVTQLAFVWVLNRRLPPDGGPQRDGPLFGDVRAGANARLIAAAPELADALKHTLRMLEAAYRQLGMYSPHNPRIQAARAALRKAGME